MSALLSKASPGCLRAAARRCSVASTAPVASAHLSTAATTHKSQNTPPSELSQRPQEMREITVKGKKTMAELDEELRLKLEGMSGEGGAAGVEYENGKAEGLKRGVKSNMFRVI
ncbi:hypothetical protein GCG54_00014371 [Colletotrichum gloeosporioides]|uniref:Uncharacterized protein n=1 Tax=Colletotrichum gloeosporioides TaxID=474922 RepID=A0A8H4FD12_COLGL|nr:uncharacterized protein GCG54_00014371 [Colletotrichum gloeosporioides]KAF3797511.1 hypothetical protein GCG54_00014371 [Colletotrichum gloeosporioides]